MDMPHESAEPSRLSLLWDTIQESEDYPLFRLVYLSRPKGAFADEDLDEIEEKSVNNNSERDVTGLLIVNGDKVLQILEGPEKEVRELYAKIEADDRHEVVKLLDPVEDDIRYLMTWNMVVRRLTGIPTEVLEQFNQVYNELLEAPSEAEISLEHIELFKTISLLGSIQPAG